MFEGMRLGYFYEREKRLEMWGPGPWIDEPDSVQWVHQPFGYPCHLVRVDEIATWSGYAGVAKGHPLHSVHHDRLYLIADAHGGLSFSGPLDFEDERHRPDPAFKEHWFFGFDAAHYMDVMPFMVRRMKQPGTYKDFRYMRGHAEALVEALWNWRDKPAPGLRMTYTEGGA